MRLEKQTGAMYTSVLFPPKTNREFGTIECRHRIYASKIVMLVTQLDSEKLYRPDKLNLRGEVSNLSERTALVTNHRIIEQKNNCKIFFGSLHFSCSWATL